MTTKRRGRPRRADESASERVEVRFTKTEMQAIRALALSHGYTVAELLRLGALTVAEDMAEGPEPLKLGGLGRVVLFYRL